MTAQEPEVISPKDQILAQIMNSAEMQQTSPEDLYQQMGQIYFLIKDDEVSNMISEDPDLKELLPTFSHLLRTSNIDRDKNGRVVSAMMKIRIRRALRMQLMVNKTPSLVSQAKFDSMVNYGEGIVEDAKEGWRGRLVTERIKTYKIESTQQPNKQGGILSKLFGGR